MLINLSYSKIMLWIAFATLFVTIVVPFIIWWFQSRRRAPAIGECFLYAQGGHGITGLELDGICKPVHNHGYPTISNWISKRPNTKRQSPIYHFSITNPGTWEIHITNIWIEVQEFKRGRFYLGQGETVGGGKYQKYECELKGATGRYACDLIDKNIKFIRIDSKTSEIIEVSVSSDVQGEYKLSLEIEYFNGRKTRCIPVKIPDSPIIFFAQYSILTVNWAQKWLC